MTFLFNYKEQVGKQAGLQDLIGCLIPVVKGEPIWFQGAPLFLTFVCVVSQTPIESSIDPPLNGKSEVLINKFCSGRLRQTLNSIKACTI